MEFYLVKFYDTRYANIHEHYVCSADIEDTLRRIEAEEPFVKAIEWIVVDEDDLPDIAIVIQK